MVKYVCFAIICFCLLPERCGAQSSGQVPIAKRFRLAQGDMEDFMASLRQELSGGKTKLNPNHIDKNGSEERIWIRGDITRRLSLFDQKTPEECDIFIEIIRLSLIEIFNVSYAYYKIFIEIKLEISPNGNQWRRAPPDYTAQFREAIIDDIMEAYRNYCKMKNSKQFIVGGIPGDYICLKENG